jgi:alpha-methylacyl-CoA racemase
MMLSDMGAEVISVLRPGAIGSPSDDAVIRDVPTRGRRSIALDLKHEAGRDVLFALLDRAHVFIEPFRVGVVESLGIGPDTCLARNPCLVYARMTGWGQQGPYADAAGHDINYISLSGALERIGRTGDSPTPPLNLVGVGGGGMLLAFGVACALLEARRSGEGQIIDVAMVDAASTLMTPFYGWLDQPLFDGERGSNLLDSGAWFNEVYETADHQYVSIGAIESQFRAELLERIGGEASLLESQPDQSSWPERKQRMAEIFRRKTRAEWCELLEGTDACFAPVLSLREAPTHPHNTERGSFVEVAGIMQPAPAPRFSRTPGLIQGPPPRPGEHTAEVLADLLGLSAAEIDHLRAGGVCN